MTDICLTMALFGPAWFDDWRETVKRAGAVDGHERVESWNTDD